MTDQKPLTRSFFKVTDPMSSRQRRQPSFLFEFCSDIAHIPGLDNVVADAIARQYNEDSPCYVAAISRVLTDVDFIDMAARQAQDNALRRN